MTRRRPFRPDTPEGLEARVALSGPTTALVARPARPAALRIGALGDSLTDEYRTSRTDRKAARSWVEILATERRLNFGPHSPVRRRDARGAGYAANWAKVGATSDDMVRDQLPGLADQVRKGRANLVAIFIGANDFLRYATGFSPLNPPTPADAAAGLRKVADRADDNVTTAVRTILAAHPNAKVVLFTLPDVRSLPAVAPLYASPRVRPLIDSVGAAIGGFNARLKELAAGEPGRVAVADVGAAVSALGAAANAVGLVRVGGKAIDMRTPGSEPVRFFLADGAHLGTVAQGLVASLFVQAADASFHARIRPLRPAEIVKIAKLRRGG